MRVSGPPMSDGELILVAAALLAAGIAASLLASRVRLPGLLLFLGARDGDRHGRPRLDRLQRLRAGAHDRRRRARADPVRGRAHGGLRGDPAGAAAGAVARDPRHARHRASICGLAASWLLDLSTLEGLLLGAIISATDGAAIFALLRGSTLRRRLARTLEGESGFNDPVAVLLVIGFIDWIQQPDYGVLDMAAPVRARAGHRRGRRASRVGWLAVAGRCRRTRLAIAGPVPGRDAGHCGARLRRAPTRCTARASSPSTWPGWCSGRRASRPSGR